ncbi:uncharacterized protein NESG_01093 [Nematocida ausubeli]|uniref:Uncharacterized protein n=1 Tax=Nematocida ausubeli (strain ATCC PRA-371 / ERTm2) TaxID=1913371 RepID=A0A086J1G4_NEMA1|nr:uncharacterized protein NESG_01093 [Nematocida ausubeli]KAI5132498.1 hypothetical protein NEAUS07_0160 [Nematocida ausubeli]KAI5147037.1 hypothetical protein NEAUS05_0368 [Nematocida ausubeli]KFG25982.1 hypothetical protein NESG_01093 [Nematocida ausubeli]
MCFYSPIYWEIKCILHIVKQFILHRYKKRNKAVEAEKRRKVAHSKEPSLVRHEERNEKKQREQHTLGK